MKVVVEPKKKKSSLQLKFKRVVIVTIHENRSSDPNLINPSPVNAISF